jgi:hypothetical protein
MEVCPMSVCVVLSCVGKGLATSRSLVQRLLPYTINWLWNQGGGGEDWRPRHITGVSSYARRRRKWRYFVWKGKKLVVVWDEDAIWRWLLLRIVFKHVVPWNGEINFQVSGNTFTVLMHWHGFLFVKYWPSLFMFCANVVSRVYWKISFSAWLFNQLEIFNCYIQCIEGGTKVMPPFFSENIIAITVKFTWVFRTSFQLRGNFSTKLSSFSTYFCQHCAWRCKSTLWNSLP